jgi:hypothetical protein
LARYLLTRSEENARQMRKIQHDPQDVASLPKFPAHLN